MWRKGSGVGVRVGLAVGIGEGVAVGLGGGSIKGLRIGGLVSRTNPVRLSARIKKTRLFK